MYAIRSYYADDLVRRDCNPGAATRVVVLQQAVRSERTDAYRSERIAVDVAVTAEIRDAEDERRVLGRGNGVVSSYNFV